MIKKISSILLATLLIFVCIITVSAEANDVYDDAGLFYESEAIQNSIDEFKEATGWNIAIVTTDDSNGKSSMAYADDFYDELFGINTDGILYLIDMDNRENWISTSGEAILYIDDDRIERILDKTTPNLSDGDFDGAAIAFIQTTAKYYRDGIPDSNKDYTIDRDGEYVRKPNYDAAIPAIVIALIAAGIGVIIVVVRYKIHSTPSANVYMDQRETSFRDRRDLFIREYTTQVHIDRDSGGGGRSGGGSSTHHSSSGGCHGGGGRGF